MAIEVNPFPIGYVVVSGSKKSLATEFSGLGFPEKLNALYLEAHPNTSGSIFLGDSTLDISTAAPTGIVCIVDPGQRETLGGVLPGNRIDWMKYYVHGDNSGDVLLLSGEIE